MQNPAEIGEKNLSRKLWEGDMMEKKNKEVRKG